MLKSEKKIYEKRSESRRRRVRRKEAPRRDVCGEKRQPATMRAAKEAEKPTTSWVKKESANNGGACFP
ncbi:unnamed protein product [Citrullus colocynthis]|uniref:Uncharacterized protein n=1 Tax=Citrullus colocynthis TaxID=252529 RepID=A0ABP0YSX6_9ROSI